jgi:hypothetical protein
MQPYKSGATNLLGQTLNPTQSLPFQNRQSGIETGQTQCRFSFVGGGGSWYALTTERFSSHGGSPVRETNEIATACT